MEYEALALMGQGLGLGPGLKHEGVVLKLRLGHEV
jgi:hypothetical protein